MKGLRVAASFLTRIRAGTAVAGAEDIARGVPWFPVVGGLVGVAVAGVYVGSRSVVPPFVAAGVAVAIGLWVTGAFHEDGLADTADAFGGRRTRDEALRIMKDPRLGTYGTSALALALLIRVATIAALDAGSALVVIPAAHALSRACAIALFRGPIASEEGLGASYASAVTRRQSTTAIVVALVIGALLLGPLVAAAAAGVAIVATGVGRLARRRIGGVTGDVMGAAQQAGEIVVLLVCVGATRGGLNLPWW